MICAHVGVGKNINIAAANRAARNHFFCAAGLMAAWSDTFSQKNALQNPVFLSLRVCHPERSVSGVEGSGMLLQGVFPDATRIESVRGLPG